MQASAEISHKVRLAIKTKLTELGAYVDDELPDYVLVMVANRRGRTDMKKELELFLGDATERFCTWLFGVLDKLKDAKKGHEKGDDDEQDKKTEKVDEKADLDDYSESEEDEPKKQSQKTNDKPKKKEKTKEKEKPKDIGEKLQNISENKRPSKKSSRTRSRSKSPMLRMDKSPVPLRMDRQTARSDRRRGKSRSRSRSRDRRRRSRSRDHRRRSRSVSRDRKDKKRDKKIRKDKKSRQRSASRSRSPSRKESEKAAENDDEKRSRISKKIRAAGGLKSTVAVQKEPSELDEAEQKELEIRKVRGDKEKPIKAVKPTSNLIIRAINDSAGSKNLSITRSITVKSMPSKKSGTPDTKPSDSKKEKTGSKRKSKGKEEPEHDVKLKKVKNGGTDQRVFVTKTDDDDKKLKKKKAEKGKKARAVSPKFFVTLDGEKKAKDDAATPAKPSSPAKQTDHLIIHPNITSDDSDDESSKNIYPSRTTTAQEEAAKIKELQAQNPLPPIELGIKQSVTLDLGSIDSDDPDTRTIFVSGLDWRVTEKELKEHFEVCGAIVRVTVLKDRYTQFSKGCAYIQFSTMEQRTTACAFDKTEVYGRTIRVTEKMSQTQMQSAYPPTAAAYATKPFGYQGEQPSKYTFRKNAASGKSQYSWTRNGYMPPR